MGPASHCECPREGSRWPPPGHPTAPFPHVSRLWLEQGQLGGRAGPRKRKVFDVKACFEARKETSQGFGRRHFIWLPSFRPPSRKKAGGNVSHPTPCAFHLHPPSRGHPFRTTSPAPGFLTTGAPSSAQTPVRGPHPDGPHQTELWWRGSPIHLSPIRAGGGSTSRKEGEETMGPGGLSLGYTLDIT